MENFDVVVIGAGPGGYVAAIRCSQLGMKTAIVEKDKLGGVCLNVGCIPSKAMITAAHWLHKAQHDFNDMGLMIKEPIQVDMKKLLQWKSSVSEKMSNGVTQLLKGNKVQVLKGDAEFVGKNEIKVKSLNGELTTYTAKNFILAMGSRPIEISGFKFDERDVLSSTGALDLSEVPKKIAVIGGGYIGLEISSYLKKLGSEVTVLEFQNAVLAGAVDPECASVVAKKFEKSGAKILYGAKAISQKKLSSNDIELKYEINGKTETLRVDKILVTVGRRPNGDQNHLKALGVRIDDKGFVQVDAQRRTNLSHVFAIGDLAGQPMLAHKASFEGVMVAEILAGQNRVYDVKTVPAVVFTDPEIASAGMTEAEAIAKGYQIKSAKFPFAANGRAVSMMETDGFVKMLADSKTGVLLGVHIVGPEASNLISEAALAIEMGARIEDLALTIHPHPTLGETMMETAEAVLGHAIHVIQRPLSNAIPAIKLQNK